MTKERFGFDLDLTVHIPIEYVLEIDANPRQYLDLIEESLIPESSASTRNPSMEWRF